MKSIKDFMEKEIKIRAMGYRTKYIELVTTIFGKSTRKEIKNDQKNKDIVCEALEEIIDYAIDTSVIVADIYLLARIFKDFDMTKMKTHANYISDQPDKAYNIIIYAGEYHARLYRRYLKEVAGFEKIASTGESDINHPDCIDMRTIPQPFFSTWSQPWEDLWSKYIVEQIKEDEYKTFDDLLNYSE